jgi:hypothetical protein
VSGVSTTITVPLDSVKRVTHAFSDYFATLTITLTVSINGRFVCPTIFINGCQEFSQPFIEMVDVFTIHL